MFPAGLRADSVSGLSAAHPWSLWAVLSTHQQRGARSVKGRGSEHPLRGLTVSCGPESDCTTVKREFLGLRRPEREASARAPEDKPGRKHYFLGA